MTRTSVLAALAAPAILVIVAMSLVVPAQAHTPIEDYYPSVWKQDLSVEWGFVNSFPNNDFRQRVVGAANEWNDENQPMTFHKRQSDYADFSATGCPNTYQKDGIHMGPIDGQFGVYAKAFTCVFTSDNTELYSVNIKFDQAENWYKGTGTPSPSQVDALSVATHEFGHATGFSGPFESGHFDPDADECTMTPKQTMCPFIEYGQTYQRGLETHDQHTFQNAYT
jgi:hypothetical protein